MLYEYKKNICKDELDFNIILLRYNGLSEPDIAMRLECNKSTVSRRLRRLKDKGFKDPFEIAENAKRECLKIGRIGELTVANVFEKMRINYKWTGKEVGKNPDFVILNTAIEVKNLREGAYLTRSEVEKYVISRFENYKNKKKILFITSGVKINDDARKLLKENSVRVIRIGKQIKDLSPITSHRLYFRLKRTRGLLEELLSGEQSENSVSSFVELLLMTNGIIRKCRGDNREGG